MIKKILILLPIIMFTYTHTMQDLRSALLAALPLSKSVMREVTDLDDLAPFSHTIVAFATHPPTLNDAGFTLKEYTKTRYAYMHPREENYKTKVHCHPLSYLVPFDEDIDQEDPHQFDTSSFSNHHQLFVRMPTHAELSQIEKAIIDGDARFEFMDPVMHIVANQLRATEKKTEKKDTPECKEVNKRKK